MLLNRKYFGGEIRRPLLRWSKKRSRRVWGSHDGALDLITINKRLDDDTIPIYVLDYVLYHEMLHARHEWLYEKGIRKVHTRDFKAEETSFPHYKDAIRWLNGATR